MCVAPVLGTGNLAGASKMRGLTVLPKDFVDLLNGLAFVMDAAAGGAGTILDSGQAPSPHAQG